MSGVALAQVANPPTLLGGLFFRFATGPCKITNGGATTRSCNLALPRSHTAEASAASMLSPWGGRAWFVRCLSVGRCAGRKDGYMPSESCVLTVGTGGTLGQCPVFDTEDSPLGKDSVTIGAKSFAGTGTGTQHTYCRWHGACVGLHMHSGVAGLQLFNWVVRLRACCGWQVITTLALWARLCGRGNASRGARMRRSKVRR